MRTYDIETAPSLTPTALAGALRDLLACPRREPSAERLARFVVDVVGFAGALEEVLSEPALPLPVRVAAACALCDLREKGGQPAL